MPSVQTSALLKAEQDKLDAIFYGTEAALVIFQGPEFIVEMFNQKYQDIYPERVLLGKSIFEAVPELKDSKFPDILKQVYETGNHYTSHEGMVRIYNPVVKQLEERYFDSTFSRISYGEGKPFSILATPREVTDRVLTRKKLEENFKALEQERDLRERFVSALTHDLRTPLAVAKVCSEFLKTESQDPETVVEMATRISSGIDRADRMIRDLLDANRISAGEGTPILVGECRLDLIINHVVADLREIHGEKFQVLNKAGEVCGFWDHMALHRVIDNLANNAIKYGLPNSVVSLKLKRQASQVEISVHNAGTPIPLIEQENLFEPYRRSKSAIKSGTVGWGMGLAIVKGLVEAHGGSVHVESSTSSGTTFTVLLPIDSRNKE